MDSFSEKETELSALRLEYEKVCQSLKTAKYRLLDQLDANHVLPHVLGIVIASVVNRTLL